MIHIPFSGCSASSPRANPGASYDKGACQAVVRREFYTVLSFFFLLRKHYVKFESILYRLIVNYRKQDNFFECIGRVLELDEYLLPMEEDEGIPLGPENPPVCGSIGDVIRILITAPRSRRCCRCGRR